MIHRKHRFLANGTYIRKYKLKKVSRIRHRQSPTDFSALSAGLSGKIVPHDIDLQITARTKDGRVHREPIKGGAEYFLTLEVKRTGDSPDSAQEWSLLGESKRLNSVTMLVHSKRRKLRNGCWDFLPWMYELILPDGTNIGVPTNLDDFNARLARWCNAPSLGIQPWR